MQTKTGTSQPELIESGIDYLTATCNRDRAGRKMAALADSILLREKGRGNLMKDWRWEGYKGFQCGSIQSGVRDDGLIVRLSSHVAQDHGQKALELATNVTRIDLQVTLRLPDGKKDLSTKHFREAVKYKKESGSKLEIRHVMVHGGGSTLYLGRRSSDYFFRCYDKQHESGLDHYRNCWRNELETKGDAAKALWDRLLDADSPGSFAESLLWTYMHKRRLRPIWSSNPTHTLCVPVRSTDSQKALRWFACQVSKKVEWLVEIGYGPEALEALGLTQDVLERLMVQRKGPRELKGETEENGSREMHSRVRLLRTGS